MQMGPTRLRPAMAGLAGVLATTVVLGACGSDEGGGPSASEADVTVLAEDTLQFDQTSYSVPAGEVVVRPGQEKLVFYEAVNHSKEPIVGTRHDDVICGSKHADVIRGRGGNDHIYSRGGNDTVYAGPGDDAVFARGGGADTVFGKGGYDTAWVDDADKVGPTVEARNP